MPNTDTVILLGTISTWIAVILALAALIGVVGPWKAVKAAYSDWNRALDEVHDTRQEYITKGYGIGRTFRFLRRSKVPLLIPGTTTYAMYNLPPLIPAVDGRWALEEIRPTKCRTGWAKICRLLEAYSIVEVEVSIIAAKSSFDTKYQQKQTPSRVLDLMERKRGRLIYRHGHAWLPVSRHWILVVGLLGRYGDRQDNGRLITPTIRRDLDEERTLMNDSNSGPDLSSVTSDSSTSHNEFSFIPLESSRRTKISGVTGVIQKLKTIRNEPNLSSPLSFHMHNEDERGHILGNESSSLETMFWLAQGFLPCSEEGIVYSLENPTMYPDQLHPEELPSNQSHLDLETPRGTNRHVIRLSLSKDRPRSLRLAMEAFRLQRARIKHWSRTEMANSRERLFPTDSLGLTGAFMIRAELENMVYAFLALSWTPSSFVIWKKNTTMWTKLLVSTASFIHTLLPIVWKSEHLKPVADDPRELDDYHRWKDMTRFNQRKSRDLYLLDGLLSKASHQSINVNDTIATALVTNTAFQDRVRHLVENYEENAAPTTLRISTETSKDYSVTLATLSWNDEEEFTTTCQANLQSDILEISQADLLLAALRAATRCALWTTSLDSKPLLDFVGSLKNIAYVG